MKNKSSVAMRAISDPPKTVQVAQQPEEFAKLIVLAVTSPGIDQAFEDARDWYNDRRDKFMADVARAMSEL
ncbi:hypothetical protein [Limnofasciculus baicalensis]|uniref:Uncharacterized protein n=1 Tax=Limnofasciculus baicalensis BBK-W-15 TaxID=2699891 RepID=A0AAE3KLK3_9CYAN|nr:hypothetical protein [Limnofasciculus baicalensis]MCP2728625.1 hypothetical protein [Limnofasciculus baicalensis BBK-W-15]